MMLHLRSIKLPNRQKFLPGAGQWENTKESKVIPALQEPNLNQSTTTAVFYLLLQIISRHALSSRVLGSVGTGGVCGVKGD